MTAMLDFRDVELYYDHVYALKGVSIDLDRRRNRRLDRSQWCRESRRSCARLPGLQISAGSVHFEGERLDG